MRPMNKLTLILPIFLMLAACSKLAFNALNAPTHFADVTRQKDIVFDSQHNLKLDIYRDEQFSDDEGLPVIVFFYGGRWQHGEKSEYQFAGNKFAEKGYVAVLPNYRKYPDVQFPDFVYDGARAVAWVKQNIAKHGGDPQKIYLAGHSAGAHIVALLTTDERYLTSVEVDPHQDIRACISISGPYEFEPQEQPYKKIFAQDKSNDYYNIQAINFIEGNEVPMLLLHGKKDEIVKANQSFFLQEKIQSKGGEAKVISYDDIDHIQIMTELSWVGQDKASVLEDIDQFIQDMENNKPISN